MDLIDEIFGVGGENPSYFDRDITSVTTDGRYNFYIPVTLTVEDYTALEIDPDQEEETLTHGNLSAGLQLYAHRKRRKF